MNKTYLSVIIKVPQIQSPCTVHGSKQSRVDWGPLHVIHVITIVFKRIQRARVLKRNRNKNNNYLVRVLASIRLKGAAQVESNMQRRRLSFPIFDCSCSVTNTQGRIIRYDFSYGDRMRHAYVMTAALCVNCPKSCRGLVVSMSLHARKSFRVNRPLLNFKFYTIFLN